MSLADAWMEQHSDATRFQTAALQEWCAVKPSSADWFDWLNRTGQQLDEWAPALFHVLDQDTQGWTSFLDGVNQQQQHSPLGLLHKMRTTAVRSGQQFAPLPVACLEALAATVSTTTMLWKKQFLVRSPEFWFGPGQKLDPVGIAPLFSLAVHLMQHAEFPAKQLPMLEWSPSSLYDDYGMAPETLQPQLAPIQHALEYAVYKHQVIENGGKDDLALAEMHDYFQRYGIDMPSFEALLDLTQNQAGISSYIPVLQCMLSPTIEQYSVDFGDDISQP